jgi:hypothetical protein
MMSNVKKLPDAYLKRYEDGSKSNHAKMLELNELQRDEFYEAMQQVLDSLDIDLATGATLDRYGEILNQKRGALKDDSYRVMLRFKIAKLLNKGDYNSLMKLAVFLLNCNDGDLIIQDVGNATVEIVSLPLANLFESDFSFSQVIDMIKELLPCGVNVAEANFVGTFELSELREDETLIYNELKGFADGEPATIGGYLGHVDADERDESGTIILPT